MFRIYFNNRHINIVSTYSQALTDPNSTIYRPQSEKDLHNVINIFKQNNKIVSLYLLSNHPEKDFKAILSKMKMIIAAGGIVQNDEHEILTIFRNGYWDLPKGKVEEGESVEEAAIREVCEECGINSPIQIKKNLCNSYHTYKQDGKLVVKETHWFAMSIENKGEEIKPQIEENIEKVEWLRIDKADHFINNTPNIYPSIRDVVVKYLNQLS